MKEHIDRERLIDYQFDLLEDEERGQIDAHLADCDECRVMLDGVKAQFAQLDLVRDEATAQLPEELRESVMELASAPAKPKPTYLKFIVFSAAAAIAVLLIFRDKPVEKPAPSDPPGHVLVADKFADEKPPFEPGSNIELNVLPRRDHVQLSIYNKADLTLVRERRKLTMKKGWNWLQYMWANTLIDPTSLQLQPVGAPDDVDVVKLVFPPRMAGVGRWLLHSKVSGQVECEITYFTSGIKWRAFYEGLLSKDESTMELKSYVRIDNASGEDYEDAQTRLVVGQLRLWDRVADLATRKYAYGAPIPEERMFPESFENPDFGKEDKKKGPVFGEPPPERALKTIKKEGLSEYFLYTIEGTETIPNRWGKRLPSMKTVRVPVTNLYKFDEERWGSSVVRFISFVNDKASKLGETPLPDGKFRLYAEARTVPKVDDPQGPYTSYVGGSSVKYIPVEETAEIELGAVKKVQVRPVLLSKQTEKYQFDKNGNISGWDEVQSWKLELSNARDIPADVQVTRAFNSDSWQLVMTGGKAEYTKHDITHARFEATLDAFEKRTLKYTVRIKHGVNKETIQRN